MVMIISRIITGEGKPMMRGWRAVEKTDRPLPSYSISTQIA